MKKRRANGAGSYQVTSNGKVRGRRSYTRADGLKKNFFVTGSSESECRKKLEREIMKFESESFTDEDFKALPLSALCSQHLLSKERKLKPKSIDRNNVTIKQIESTTYGHQQVGTITPSDIETTISELLDSGLSASSCIKALDVINSAYKWAISADRLNKNPVESVYANLKYVCRKKESKSAADQDVIVLTQEDAKKFENTCLQMENNKYKYIGGKLGFFLLNTGVRIGEAIALKWSDYDFTTRYLTVNKSSSVYKHKGAQPGKVYIMGTGTTKNDAARIIALNSKADKLLRKIRALDNFPDSETYIFRNSVGNPFTTSASYNDIKKIYIEANLINSQNNYKQLQHILRRTFATRLYDKGYTVEKIAAYLGDRPETVIKHYIAMRETRNGKAVIDLKQDQPKDKKVQVKYK